MAHHTEEYRSWGDIIERAAKPHPFSGQYARRQQSDPSWDLGTDFDGAIKLAHEGWPEGEAFVKKFSSAMFDRLASTIERQVINYDVEGTGIDIARFVDGEPECWQRIEPVLTDGPGRKQIRIVYNGGASCGISAQTLMAKGAAVAALIDLLEYAGNSVELTVAFQTEELSNSASCLTRVKDFEQPLDLGRVAFAVAHPAMLRRIVFAIMEQYPAGYRETLGDGSYGRPADVIETQRGDIYIGKAYYGEPQWTDPRVAEKWVREQLVAQGVKLEEAEEGSTVELPSVPAPAYTPRPWSPPPRRRRRRW